MKEEGFGLPLFFVGIFQTVGGAAPYGLDSNDSANLSIEYVFLAILFWIYYN